MKILYILPLACLLFSIACKNLASPSGEDKTSPQPPPFETEEAPSSEEPLPSTPPAPPQAEKKSDSTSPAAPQDPSNTAANQADSASSQPQASEETHPPQEPAPSPRGTFHDPSKDIVYYLDLSGTAPPLEVPTDPTAAESAQNVPDWAQYAIWYQIFPERFRNGDPRNDPTHDSLEFPDTVPASWQVTPWTRQWYEREPAWETGKSFFDSVFNRRYGGDLQGVIEKLDYLADLGINAIYFNPVFYGRSTHKYDGACLHHIDPFFGPDPIGDLAIIEKENEDPSNWQWTSADKLFLHLLQEAKKRNIRVIIDGVFNHTGTHFFAFRDIKLNQENSPYRDWYQIEEFDDPRTRRYEFRYKGWWGFGTLPVLRHTPDGLNMHPAPKAYIFEITRRWMDPNGDGNPSDGIDGWRLDVADELPIGFWKDWNAHVRKINPNAYTVAEVWKDASQFIIQGGFSAAMNYHGFAVPVKGYLIDRAIRASEFTKMIRDRRNAHHPSVARALQNLMDSHDTDRLASMIVNSKNRNYINAAIFDYDESRFVSARQNPKYNTRKPSEEHRTLQRLILFYQVTAVGAPMIYYGTEAGMWGADDPCDRKPMPWPDLPMEPETLDPRGHRHDPDENQFDSSLHATYRAALCFRAQNKALADGHQHDIYVNDAEDTFAFIRQNDSQKILVAINRSEEPRTFSIPLEDFKFTLKTANQLFSSYPLDPPVTPHIKNDALHFTLPPLVGVAFEIN
ncbi:MAG: alpha-amylase family glycosyl hydrolase [Methylacidiphilales bacterium]|nr:alpha-amylase family glycosyl hydrolase [Candidatus Methylacidiphilales bacterium]MDW8349169.1 alpha-amylase family glycosyl hydrolase [Verrucomicrobiae bacterium]